MDRVNAASRTVEMCAPYAERAEVPGNANIESPPLAMIDRDFGPTLEAFLGDVASLNPSSTTDRNFDKAIASAFGTQALAPCAELFLDASGNLLNTPPSPPNACPPQPDLAAPSPALDCVGRILFPSDEDSAAEFRKLAQDSPASCASDIWTCLDVLETNPPSSVPGKWDDTSPEPFPPIGERNVDLGEAVHQHRQALDLLRVLIATRRAAEQVDALAGHAKRIASYFREAKIPNIPAYETADRRPHRSAPPRHHSHPRYAALPAAASPKDELRERMVKAGEARERHYKEAFQRISAVVADCAEEDSLTECAKAVHSYRDSADCLRKEMEELESAAARANAGLPGAANEELAHIVGKLRSYYDWMSEGDAVVARIQSGDVRGLVRQFGKRSSHLVASLVFSSIRSLARDVNERLSALDNQAYGALTLTSILFGTNLDGWSEQAFAEVGQSASDMLCSVGLTPEAFVSRACEELVRGDTADGGGLLPVEPMYRGMAYGFKRCASLSMAAPPPGGASAFDERHWDSRLAANAAGGAVTPVVPQATSIDNPLMAQAILGTWALATSFHVLHGNEPPPIRRVPVEMMDAFLSALLERYPTPGLHPRAGEQLALAASQELQIVNSVWASTIQQLSARQSADLTAVSNEISSLIGGQREYVQASQGVIQALEQFGERDEGERAAHSMCLYLHDDPFLEESFQTPATCRQANTMSGVASIDFGAHFPTGRWDPRDKDGASDTHKDKLDKIEKGLKRLATLLRQGRDGRNVEFHVDVEGLASKPSYTCKQLLGSLPPCLHDPIRPCWSYEFVRFPNSEKVECKRNEKDDGDANPVLAVLRAWAVADVLKKELCPNSEGCAWLIKPSLEPHVIHKGSEDEQRVLITIRPANK